MSFFVSESIKDRIDEKTFAGQESFKTKSTYTLIEKNKTIGTLNVFEEIEYDNRDISKIVLKMPYNIIKNILPGHDELSLLITLETEKKYNIELERITNIDNNNYYCSFKTV